MDNYERTASGMVFIRESSEQSRMDRKNKLKCFLLSLIEEEFELSFRSQHCLNNSGIKLIGQLVQKSASELLHLRNFGRTSLRDIEEDLKANGLTLDMALNFFPWNGTGEGNELIQILSLQKPGGGFFIDNQTARKLDIDLKELNQPLSKKRQSLIYTKYLLDRLESKFEKDAPYLTELLKSHRQWLERESK
ncbi:MAG: DNA-directed RNA polymerase subunit alpha C-terminal domain-containing protein [Smithella sp.]